MKTFFLLIFFISSTTFANENLRIFKNEKYQPLELKTFQGFKLSADCFKKMPPTCEAFKATTKKVKETPMATNAAHPAAHYCTDAGGQNRIAKDSKNAQYDFCLFSDGSLIESWGLYESVHPARSIEAKSR